MDRPLDYVPKKNEVVAPDRPWNPAPDFLCITNSHRLGPADTHTPVGGDTKEE